MSLSTLVWLALRKSLIENIAAVPEVYGPVVVGVVHSPDVLGQPVHVRPGVASLHHRSGAASKYLFLSGIKRLLNTDR